MDENIRIKINCFFNKLFCSDIATKFQLYFIIQSDILAIMHMNFDEF